MLLYALTIFLSAFLLFQVQPMIAKIILPWFGGSAAVWSAAMLFFQLLLLAGYSYAWVLIRFLKPKAQVLTHIGLLALGVATLPILPSAGWKPSPGDDPTLRIILLLGATIGLPYLLLSATSPLLQAWYVRSRKGAMPYRFFALSNLGSMLALISYPFAVEPRFATSLQAYMWSGGFVVFAVTCAGVAWFRSSWADAVAVEKFEEAAADRPSATQLILWMSFAACASALLVSVTNHLSQNVAPIPLLWVVPLSLYLLTFILCFDSDKFYNRSFFLPQLAIVLGVMAYIVYASGGNVNVFALIPVLSICLFLACMFCHGELSARKPHPRHLTIFYLMISLGGAVGGLFVAFIAPRFFPSYLELPISIVACGVLGVVAAWDVVAERIPPAVIRTLAISGVIALTGFCAYKEGEDLKGYRVTVRNFYGMLKVRDDIEEKAGPVRVLVHGTINHGEEVMQPALLTTPTSYYTATSGVGRAMTVLQRKGPVRVGVVGLGAGVMAAWSRAGDYFRYYEINPIVEGIARTQFFFVPRSQADLKVLLGDARLVLERQEPQNFDLLAIDAFSSDSIPVHLLTREAFELYFRHLKPGGILAVHISNKYLTLEPVVQRNADDMHKTAYVIEDDPDNNEYMSATTWMLVSGSDAAFGETPLDHGILNTYKTPSGFRAWTDDYSNIIKILKQ
ncbi:MAG: fused MFS/spermidine synthase [Bryobacteraceae bacterium]